jgi:hypothetical protein
MHTFPLSLLVSQDKDGRTGGHLLPRGMNFSPNYSERIILDFKRVMDADSLLLGCPGPLNSYFMETHLFFFYHSSDATFGFPER